MIEKTFKINGLDGHKIFVASWMPENNEKINGVVQINHGMAEHCLRYRDFAKFLTENGYGVYAHDHRGHGQSLGIEEDIGFFNDKEGWNNVVDEAYKVTEHIKKENNNTNIFVLGHSMGSLITRGYIQKYGKEVKGAVISGTSATKGFLGVAGIGVARLICLTKGNRYKSKLLTDLSFGSFNKKFAPNKTEYDWLSRDEQQVKKYVDDEKCGFMCTSRFYVDLLEGLSNISKKRNILKTPKNLPILFISGDNDPVGDMGKGIKKVTDTYKSLGYNVKVILYEGGRHEIINETNNTVVYDDIIGFINSLK
ncbi:alpha/beta hydrolase [Vallitalea sp.]|jgi:alpha-beta hydrolase superfamily lysophospholipase|uniref:alpha/beta hydrolase n=1 Tax=Vallitalea sp. TaxID=1882829 RepID=UPI0025EE7A2D|nr:alpha/beta hydrolase [Vallitalea sp.]MCT4685859.1 lysophospholipase [Vallitalea sp.]